MNVMTVLSEQLHDSPLVTSTQWSHLIAGSSRVRSIQNMKSLSGISNQTVDFIACRTTRCGRRRHRFPSSGLEIGTLDLLLSYLSCQRTLYGQHHSPIYTGGMAPQTLKFSEVLIISHPTGFFLTHLISPRLVSIAVQNRPSSQF